MFGSMIALLDTLLHCVVEGCPSSHRADDYACAADQTSNHTIMVHVQPDRSLSAYDHRFSIPPYVVIRGIFLLCAIFVSDQLVELINHPCSTNRPNRHRPIRLYAFARQLSPRRFPFAAQLPHSTSLSIDPPLHVRAASRFAPGQPVVAPHLLRAQGLRAGCGRVDLLRAAREFVIV